MTTGVSLSTDNAVNSANQSTNSSSSTSSSSNATSNSNQQNVSIWDSLASTSPVIYSNNGMTSVSSNGSTTTTSGLYGTNNAYSTAKTQQAQAAAYQIQDLLQGEPSAAKISQVDRYMAAIINTQDPDYIKAALVALGNANFGGVDGSDATSFFGAYGNAIAKVYDGVGDDKDGKKIAQQSLTKYIKALQSIGQDNPEYQVALASFFDVQKEDVGENMDLNQHKSKSDVLTIGGTVLGSVAGIAVGISGAQIGASLGALGGPVGAIAGGIAGALIGGAIGWLSEKFSKHDDGGMSEQLEKAERQTVSST